MKRLNYTSLLLGAVAVIAMTGCNTMREDRTKQRVMSGSSNTSKPVDKGERSQNMEDGTINWYLPTANRSEALVKVTATTPTEVVKDMAFKYSLVVENISDNMLDDVVVSDVLPPGIKIIDSSPKASLVFVDSGGCVGDLCPMPGSGKYTQASWKIGCLPPGEKRRISASVKALKEGEFAHCADVDYTVKKCQMFAVIAPKLAVDKIMPDEIRVNQPFPVEIKVWNSGSGMLKNVTVVDTLPAGLVGVDSNSRQVAFKINELKPDQVKKYTFQAKAVRAGTFTNNVVARSASGLNADDAEIIKAIQPQIVIQKDGSKRVPLGRIAEYKIVVGNTGDAPVTNVVVTDPIPDGSAFVSASSGGRYENGVVTWRISKLDPSKKQTLTVKIRVRKVGMMVNRASARSANCSAVSDETTTVVEGVSALLLEVVDANDPVLIGDTTSYKITVRNTGTAMGRNVTIQGFLEEEQMFVSATGSSSASKQGPVTEFRPVNIAAGKSATWTITIRAKSAADVRFKTIMNADGFGRPVQETEATTQY